MADTISQTVAIVRAELERARGAGTCPELTGETSFDHDLHCSTIDMVCISLEVEDTFDVQLPAEPLEACDTISALAELVDATLLRRAA